MSEVGVRASSQLPAASRLASLVGRHWPPAGETLGPEPAAAVAAAGDSGRRLIGRQVMFLHAYARQDVPSEWGLLGDVKVRTSQGSSHPTSFWLGIGRRPQGQTPFLSLFWLLPSPVG